MAKGDLRCSLATVALGHHVLHVWASSLVPASLQYLNVRASQSTGMKKLEMTG